MFRRWKRRNTVNDHKRDQEILDYYIKLWGEPSRKEQYYHDLKHAPQPIFVLEFPPQSEENFWTYATLGASHRSMKHPDGCDARMELFIFVEQQQPELFENMGALALYPFALDTYLGPGHTVIGEDDEGIVAGSPLTDIFISRTFLEDDKPPYMCHADGTHTHFLWVMPVYRQEREYAAQHGERAMIDIFAQHNTNAFDLYRSPVPLEDEPA